MEVEGVGRGGHLLYQTEASSESSGLVLSRRKAVGSGPNGWLLMNCGLADRRSG